MGSLCYAVEIRRRLAEWHSFASMNLIQTSNRAVTKLFENKILRTTAQCCAHNDVHFFS